MTKRRALGVVAVAAALALGVAHWQRASLSAFLAEPATDAAHAAEMTLRERKAAHSAPSRHQAAGSALPAAADAFLTPALRHQLDALLLEAGEVRDPAALKLRLASLARQRFAPADAQRAVELLDRYVDYRVAVSALKPPADMGDPHALRQSLEERRRLRERHFDEAEYQALFGSEEELDRFTLARLEIQRNPQLTATQKQSALQQAEQELGTAHRAARAETTQHLAVAAQTESLDAQGAGDSERYRQRRAIHGDEAAQRLATLDQETRDWQARLAQYEAARANLGTAELDILRQRLFSAQEQMRLDGALALRAQQLQRK